MSTTWRGRGDDDPSVRFGVRARAWLRRRIRQELFMPPPWSTADMFVLRSNGTKWPAENVSRVLDWYLTRLEHYVRWTENDGFYGTGYSHGSWTFLPEVVRLDFSTAVRAAARARDDESYSTLDEWLRADLTGALWYVGDRGGMDAVLENTRPEKERARRGRRWRLLARRPRVPTPRRRR